MSELLPIQQLLLGEATLNIGGAAAMIFAPQFMLSFIAAPGRLTLLSEGAAPEFMQWLGALFCGLTVPMLLTLPNTAGVGAQRRTVYHTLLAGEACLIPTMLWQAMNGDVKLASGALLLAAGGLAPFGALRAWILVNKPQWFVDDVNDASTAARKAQ